MSKGVERSTFIAIGILAVAIVLTVLWLWPDRSVLPNLRLDGNTPYLLSAVGQALAAVLALVFTISLVVVQLSARYSYRALTHFFDVFTIGYVSIFIIAVILPFWLLTSPNVVGVKVSLILGSVCLALLLPYFLRLQRRLTPEHLLAHLRKRAQKELVASPHAEPVSVMALENAIMSAFALKDYDTFGYGVRFLSELASEAVELEPTMIPPRPSDQMYGRVENVYLSTLGDPKAPRQVLEALEGTGYAALAKEGPNRTVLRVIDTVGHLTMEAAKGDLERVAHEGFMRLEGLGLVSAVRGWKDGTNTSVSLLTNISIVAMKEQCWFDWLEGVNEFADIGVSAAITGLADSARQVASVLATMGDYARGCTKRRVIAALLQLGAVARHMNEADLQQSVKWSLAKMEEGPGGSGRDLDFVQSALDFALKTPSPFIPDNMDFARELEEFTQSYFYDMH